MADPVIGLTIEGLGVLQQVEDSHYKLVLYEAAEKKLPQSKDARTVAINDILLSESDSKYAEIKRIEQDRTDKIRTIEQEFNTRKEELIRAAMFFKEASMFSLEVIVEQPAPPKPQDPQGQ